MSTIVSPTRGASPPDATATATLPDDPAILQQMIRELLDILRQTRHENEQLQHRFHLLLLRLYGPRTERFDPNQPLLFPDAFDTADVPTDREPPPADATAPASEPATDPKKKSRPHG